MRACLIIQVVVEYLQTAVAGMNLPKISGSKDWGVRSAIVNHARLRFTYISDARMC